MKKFIIAAMLIMLLLPTNAKAEWTTSDTTLEATYLVTHIVDFGQTRYISKNTSYYETNPILGKHPSTDKVNIYFITTGIGHVVVAYLLPDKYRKYWQYITIGIESGMIINNSRLGIKIDF